MRLADGRIYVPLPFIHKNFADAVFPLQIMADVHVNAECIKDSFPVRTHALASGFLGPAPARFPSLQKPNPIAAPIQPITPPTLACSSYPVKTRLPRPGEDCTQPEQDAA